MKKEINILTAGLFWKTNSENEKKSKFEVVEFTFDCLPSFDSAKITEFFKQELFKTLKNNKFLVTVEKTSGTNEEYKVSVEIYNELKPKSTLKILEKLLEKIRCSTEEFETLINNASQKNE